MMNDLKAFNPHSDPVELALTGSKSETNRLLVLQALWPQIKLENLAQCDDAFVMTGALNKSQGTIDVGHAGTAMRFLTAYFSCLPGTSVILTGSQRMKERPIGILVDALCNLGAKIKYIGRQGYPPISIQGQSIKGGVIQMSGSVSSQYLTALMLVASKFEQGLTIDINDTLTSLPYLKMTARMLQKLGVQVGLNDDKIVVSRARTTTGPADLGAQNWQIESDWSGASYWYSMVALEPKCRVILRNFKEQSLQGDRVIATLFEQLGVQTVFDDHKQSIMLSGTDTQLPASIEWDLIDTPDLAQTIAVCCFGLGIGCHLTGLHTLKIKETDRLTALSDELTKLGGSVKVSQNSLSLSPRQTAIISDALIETYNDHRMAMAFAPLVARTSLRIANPEVVSKSYPNFWNDMIRCGLEWSQRN